MKESTNTKLFLATIIWLIVCSFLLFMENKKLKIRNQILVDQLHTYVNDKAK